MNNALETMKRILIQNIVVIFLSIVTITSCSSDEIEGFDKSSCYINFVTPQTKDRYPVDTKDNNYEYSFSLESEDYQSHVFRFEVLIMGVPVDYDRPYTIEVINEETTADKSMYVFESSRVLKKGQVKDTVELTLFRDAVLKEEARTVTLGLIENEHFKHGIDYKQSVTLTFTDELVQPEWWKHNSYKRWFGEYYREVYEKWMEIYYLGFDHGIHPDNEEPYYWRNMPKPGSNNIWAYSQPTLFVAIAKLKKYFNDNDIYPNGDTSKAPIKLPNF